jgi:hypothetical protein
MSWDKPKTARQWLILAIPPACCVVATVAGGIIDPKEGDWMSWSLAGLFLATISAFALSIWLARVNPTTGGKIRAALICFVIFTLVNGAVSFAGCAVGSSFLPGLNFH